MCSVQLHGEYMIGIKAISAAVNDPEEHVSGRVIRILGRGDHKGEAVASDFPFHWIDCESKGGGKKSGGTQP